MGAYLNMATANQTLREYWPQPLDGYSRALTVLQARMAEIGPLPKWWRLKARREWRAKAVGIRSQWHLDVLSGRL